MEKENLRLYCFNNMYLQGIHAGIQSLHTVAEMFSIYNQEYDTHEDQYCTLHAWAKQDKTVVVLNGGMNTDLESLICFLADGENRLPWHYFHESEAALGGVLTNVGIVVPERVYNLDREACLMSYFEYKMQAYLVPRLTEFQFNLAKRIKKCKLMN